MKPLDWPLLADENIHPEVIEDLRARGKDVRSILGIGVGLQDIDVLRFATAERRVVLTHDSDFGTLAFSEGEPFVGIIYLRPGHISASFVLGTIRAIETADVDAEEPFVLVAERRGDNVRLRLRAAPRKT
jgi:predicted nuclease of predicted toxin-antitoxin system